jgi:hypothetical protein
MFFSSSEEAINNGFVPKNNRFIVKNDHINQQNRIILEIDPNRTEYAEIISTAMPTTTRRRTVVDDDDDGEIFAMSTFSVGGKVSPGRRR